MENPREKVTRKFKNKEVLVGIVGSGYVGPPLMSRYNSIGFRVLGIDIDAEKVRGLNSGESYIEYISAKGISHACSSDFEAMTDFSRAKECGALILCASTPPNKYREPDMSFVVNTTEATKLYLREG